ncbi:MAG TPA: hypothetical protein VKT72_06880 [Candidatus Baltobacteraceae bacterium]|nr:hypothetical protein [Candidatus Baltobacteraceae bacterium]
MGRRVAIVTFLLLLSTLTWAPDLRRLAGHPLGITGISFDYNAVVTNVEARAASSGIRIGDHLDLARADLTQRASYASLGTSDAGMLVRLPMLRGDIPYTAKITTFAESNERIAMIWLRDAAQIFVMFIGALVVLRRPSPATWGFFLAVFTGCGTVNDVYLLGPDWWRVVGTNLYWIVANNGPGSYGAIIFALYLLHSGPLPLWRRMVEALTYVFAAAAFIVGAWQANSLLFSSHPNGGVWFAYSALVALPLFVAPLVLIATYFESGPNLRERLRWIIGGFLLSAICNVFDQIGSQGNLGLIQMSYVTHSLLVCGIYLFIAVPVAYAVLKHHIIDVSVAVSRATVYTALSVFIIGLFALVDLFFTQALDQKSAGMIADIGLALILGFSFNTMHHRVDAFVDRFLFRKRHLAEEHVRSVTDAMAFAHNETHVRTMLTKEPIRAFDLTGARIIAELTDASDDVQTLASYLGSRRTAVRLTDGQWHVRGAAFDEFQPAAAVPLLSHGRVDSLVLYGLHMNGTDLDAEEIALLERLCAAAGSALDRLEAESLRHEIDVLRGMVRA